MPDETMIQAFAEMSEMMQVVVEAAVGYRARCEANGFSPTAAEAMAMEYHGYLMRMMLAGARK